ncbi:MAG: MBG domain-containing protein, partial [Bacteroidota bacterium]
NGTTWIEGNIGFDASTFTSHFFDDKNGWLSSGAGQLYQFKDSVWTSVSISGAGAFNEMTFIAPDQGYGTGFSTDIWTFDGAQWLIDYTGINDQFTSLFFLDENNGWAGGNGYIATFCNGIWTEELVDTGWIYDIYFTDTGSGWAMGEHGDVLTFEDPLASLIWRPIDFFPTNLQITTFSRTSNVMYAGGSSPTFSDGITRLFSSADGVTWSEINAAFENYNIFFHFYALDDALFASVADENLIPVLLKSEDGGLTWSPSQNGILTNSATLYLTALSNEVLYAATYTVSENKFIPRLYLSNDQGANWTELSVTGIPESTDAAFTDLYYTGSELILIYLNFENTSFAIYTSVDGLNWSEIESAPSSFLPQNITLDDDGTWYLSGINSTTFIGELYASDDDGFSWKPLPLTGIDEFNSSLTAIEYFNGELFLSTNSENLTETKVFTTSSSKQLQSITFDPLSSATYGDTDIMLSGFASSGLPLSYSSSNPSVATITDQVMSIQNAGTTVIEATQAGDENFQPATAVEQVLNVDKAILSTSVKNEERNVGEPNPTFELHYAGFVNGENAEVIDTLPQASTDADVSSPAGVYEISISGGADNNYDFSYTDGILTIQESHITSIDKPLKASLQVFPNPTQGNIEIRPDGMGQQILSIEVFDLTGAEFFSGEYQDNMIINFQPYPPGVYLLRMQATNDTTLFKIIRK